MVDPTEFVLSRLLSAPPPRVWAAWTEAHRLERWWGPKGMPLTVLALDVRPGGHFHYSMKLPTGDAWYGRFDYTAVEAPSRLAYLSGFADASGQRTRAPFSDSFPVLVSNTLSLEAQGEGTLLTLRAHAVNPTADELAAFTGLFSSMRQGFGSTFDALEAYLGGLD